MLPGGGELEEWLGCTFLFDGIRLPISGAGANWKIAPFSFQTEINGVPIVVEVEKGHNIDARARKPALFGFFPEETSLLYLLGTHSGFVCSGLKQKVIKLNFSPIGHLCSVQGGIVGNYPNFLSRCSVSETLEPIQ